MATPRFSRPTRCAALGLAAAMAPLAWVSILALGGCVRAPAADTPPRVATFEGPTMGTRYKVSVVVDDASPPVEKLRQDVDALLAEVNRRMSTYDSDSELSRFNRDATGEWFSVSPDTARVVRQALELAADTGGAYDPTVGPLVNLWGFGPGPDAFEPPSDEQVDAARAHVGYRLVEARLEPSALRKTDPNAYVDLSSIAKGYGVDRVSRLLAERGVEASMVEIGGEVVTRGAKPGGRPWRIGVRSASGGGPLQEVLEMGDEAVATSGDYENFFEFRGVRYSHTIDPKTGRPVTHDLASVSVRSPTCAEADGRATALMALGPVAGYDWAVERGVAALFVERKHEGGSVRYQERATPAWEARSVGDN